MEGSDIYTIINVPAALPVDLIQLKIMDILQNLGLCGENYCRTCTPCSVKYFMMGNLHITIGYIGGKTMTSLLPHAWLFYLFDHVFHLN